MTRKIKIGEMLVSSGIITEDQLKAALNGQRQLGGTVGENLIRLGYLTEEALLSSLSEQTGLQHINLTRVEISPSIQRLIKLETVRSRRLIPIGFEGKRLVVGMVDPTDLSALSEVEFQSGHPVKPVILSATHFERALGHFQTAGYGVGTLKLSGEKMPRRIPAESDITSLLKALVTWHGQDLHLSSGAIPCIRVDGEMR
ncbi:MAG TPA: hypothetical protein DEH27_05955, partial [Deltaproteobacteria bacterium]|nr:hypothetical protein [Deltaproteobacteria bacterium]